MTTTQIIAAATGISVGQANIIDRCITDKNSVTDEEICNYFNKYRACLILSEVRGIPKAEALKRCNAIIYK